MSRIAIVGGGIAGLSLAHALRRRAPRSGRDLEVIVLEKADRPGGNIRSERLSGYLCEWGPNGFLDNVPETLELVRALGLHDSIQVSDDAARRRFIYRGGKLRLVPDGVLAFLRSGLLSWRGKLRILAEPFAPKRPAGDETIHGFASRRIGREAAEIMIDSMVSGIFAGDSRRLSLRACFPKMWQMEEEHGGLFRAMLALRKKKKRGEGLETLPPALSHSETAGQAAPAGETDPGDAGARAGNSPNSAGQRMPAVASGSGSREGMGGSAAPGTSAARGAPLPPPTSAEPSGGGMGMPAGRLTSFRDGTETLTSRLVQELGPAVRTGVRVAAVHARARGDGDALDANRAACGKGAGRAQAGLEGAGEPGAGHTQEHAPERHEEHTAGFVLEIEGGARMDADAVVLSGSAAESARLLRGLDPELADILAEVESAPIAVVCLGYDEPALGRPLDGFGFLVPRGEGVRILGALWDSSIYPGRAPQGKALIRAMIGGARDPEAASLTDGELLAIVREDLRRTMGLGAEPEFFRIFRHPLGIPQYTTGHVDRLGRIEDRLHLHPGLFFAGNSYRGVSINSCIAEAGPLADRILRVFAAGTPGAATRSDPLEVKLGP